MVVATIHTLLGFIMFRSAFVSIYENGVFNSIGMDYEKGTAIWFLLFGFLLFTFGIAIYEIDKNSSKNIPASVGLVFLSTIILGIVLMPASGFWLAIPPAIAILVRK